MIKTKNSSILYLLFILCLISSNAQAKGDMGLSLGVKLLGTNWQGNNELSDTTFSTTDGGQFGINLAFQKSRFYTGVSFQGGDYTFEDDAPAQVTSTATTPSSNVIISRDELDLLAGYFFWEHISLFIDLKSISNRWSNNDYLQTFYGIGFGASGYWPLNKSWSLYGSVGVVPIGQVTTDGNKIGDGNSGALEFGGAYHFNTRNRITFGLKSQSQTYNYDSGDKTESRLNGVFVGFNHIFPF